MKNQKLSILKLFILVSLICYPGVNFILKSSSSKPSAKVATGDVKAAETSITPTPSPEPTKIPEPKVESVSKEVKAPRTAIKISPAYGRPVSMSIPKINLVAPVVLSDRTAEGNMYVPPDDKTAGWWKYGTKPGELGSAVIAGHYKIGSGAPGVFYNLNKLAVGDEIVVTKESGDVLTFVISKMETYPVGSFPMDEFFTSSDDRRLNLITCAGKYVRSKNDYTHRLAVFAVLEN